MLTLFSAFHFLVLYLSLTTTPPNRRPDGKFDDMASPIASAVLKSRVKRPSMLKKLCKPQDLLHHFPNGAYLGWSGFTGVGYPKFVSRFPLNCPRLDTIWLENGAVRTRVLTVRLQEDAHFPSRPRRTEQVAGTAQVQPFCRSLVRS